MKKYTAENYRMYVVADNATNLMILDSKTENRYLVFNWDLYDSEIACLAERFYKEGLEEQDFTNSTFTDGDFREEYRWWQEADEYIKMVEWYAVITDMDDTDWGTGSYDRAEAFDMAVSMGAGYVATIINKECVDIESVD